MCVCIFLYGVESWTSLLKVESDKRQCGGETNKERSKIFKWLHNIKQSIAALLIIIIFTNNLIKL